MILIDTNIIVYAAGTPHPYKEACNRILAEESSGGGRFTIDVETLQEVLHVYSARHERQRGFETFDDLLRIFPNPIPIQRSEAAIARELMERYTGLTARDALHAAVVIVHSLEGIASADSAFGQISGLKRFDPLELYPS